jgi:hypothetical protein
MVVKRCAAVERNQLALLKHTHGTTESAGYTLDTAVNSHAYVG